MNFILIIIVIIITFNYLLERILEYLNTTCWSDKLPDELVGIYDAEKYKKSQQYSKIKTTFEIITSTFSFIVTLLVLYFGLFGVIDNYIRLYFSNPIIIALIFFAVIGFISDIISTPADIYFTFVIEKRFGFNTTTIKTFITDKIKGWILGLLIGGILASAIIWVYINSGEWFWLLAWGIIIVFMVFFSMFYSNIIVPLFNKQTPLGEGELRNAIERFAKKTGFKLKNIYIIDGSKRSKKANAYFTGFGHKKRIVLYDTLINDHPIDELVAILAHEVGHYKKKHIYLTTLIGILETGLMLYVLSLFIGSPMLSQALGTDIPSFQIGVIAFAILYSPVSLILGLFMNIISRKNEYAADKFAGVNYNPSSLKKALIKLSVNNLSNLKPHKLNVFFYYSHPPLLERLNALDEINNENNAEA